MEEERVDGHGGSTGRVLSGHGGSLGSGAGRGLAPNRTETVFGEVS